MTTQTIGIVHPGEMGISVAASAQTAGHLVYWASEGRSANTRQRASQHGLRDAETLATLCATCDIILSVVPPHSAEDVAQQVIRHGFTGIFVDANAIAPDRAVRIGQLITTAGARFVDGGIIGGPAWKPGTTWLYLAGPAAETVASCLAGGPLETRVISPVVGQASALKMCYAAYTKGTTALLSGVLAAADHYGVWGDLRQQWSQDDPKLAEQAGTRVQQVTAKGWRFAGEMEEIAATWRAAGLPGETYDGAADLYRRMTQFKNGPRPALEDVLAALREPYGEH